MEQENNSKGLTARILGEQPTALQKTLNKTISQLLHPAKFVSIIPYYCC